MTDPAQIQSVRYNYPYYKPSVGQDFATLANAYLQGQQQKQATQQDQLGKLFPSLIDMGMIKPGQPGQSGGLSYGGMPWQVQPKNQNWNSLAEEALAKERWQKLQNPNAITFSQAALAIGNSPYSKNIKNPEDFADAVKKVQEHWNRAHGGGGVSNDPTTSDEFMNRWSQLTDEQKKQAKVDSDMQTLATNLGIDLNKL